VDYLDAQIDLSFAGLEALRFPSYPLRDHFAEKLHAYTRPRDRRTRVKDLVDLALLLELDVPRDALLRSTIEGVFRSYATHSFSQPLPLPPEEWLESFRGLALEIGLHPEDALAWHTRIETFVSAVLEL
jgi:Nucleotidyl transferase AbiEii toxin, Type IV TA system